MYFRRYDLGGEDSVDATAFAYAEKKKPITNADRIRAMSDEELAKWMAINTDCFFCKVKRKNICSLDEGTCAEEWLSWLKSSAEGAMTNG